MSTKQPIDIDARRRAATTLDVSMALSAGAGSGKTSVLAARIVESLRRGTAPSRLAAITFTEKAAGELLVRVRDTLEAQAGDAARSDDDRAVLSAVLARFGELTITTIHGFCRELLRREAFAAGFAPATTIGESAELTAVYERALASWQRGLRQKRSHLAQIVEAKTTRTSRLAALQHLDSYRHHRAVADDVPAFDLDAARAALLPLIAAVSTASKACSAPATCKLLERHQPLVDRLGAISDERDGHRHLLRLLLGGDGVVGSVGRKPDWPGDSKQVYVDALKAVLTWRASWLTAAHTEVVRSLVHHALPMVKAARDADSLAGFDDLLLDTAALLRDDVDARRRLARSFPVLLIDEVQDTDPVQAEIASLLALGPNDGDDRNTDGDARNTLFAVGDPRQSIYRFRGADVATFGALEAEITDRGAREVLATNFRSVDGIVGWVNHVYADAVGGMSDYVTQHAWRGAGVLDPVVLLQRTEDDALDEIDAAIAHLRQIRSQPAAIANADGSTRPLRGNDVMILLPSWGKADVIADRLRAAGLACVVEGGGAFYQRDEVRLLVAAARTIAEPGDTVATMIVLRGLFGVSIADIAAYVAAGGALRISIVPAIAGVVADALTVLNRLHRRCGHVPLSALLSELLAITKTLAVHALLPTGAARSANVDKLLHIVRELEAEDTSPLAVVNALEQQRLSRRGDKDIDRVDDDGDAIRITTLFKAKGLEAPLVFVLHATRNADSVDHIVDHTAGRISVKVGELVPADWDALKPVDAEQAQQERQRWMYVAATRARDQLVIVRTTTPGTKKPTKASALYDVDIAARGLPSAEALPAHEAIWHADDAGTVAVRVRRVSALSTSAVRSAASTFGEHDDAIDALLAAPRATGGDVDGIAWSNRRAAQLKQAQRGCVRWRAATATPGGSRGDRGEVPGPSSAAAVGARVGVVVHEVMERLDLSQALSLVSQQATTLAQQLSSRAALSSTEAAAVASIVARILKNPLIEQARAAPQRFAEVPFSFPTGGGVVAGTIDLLFPVDDARRRWVVFDWKSTAPAPGTPQRARYEAQLQRYATAVLKSLGDVEVTTAIVGPHEEAGPVGTVDDALEAMPAEVRDFARWLVARGVPMPAASFDLEEDLPAVAALAWLEQKVAWHVDDIDDAVRATLIERGWRLCANAMSTALALGATGSAPDDDAEGAIDDERSGMIRRGYPAHPEDARSATKPNAAFSSSSP